MTEGAPKGRHSVRVSSPGAQIAELVGVTNPDQIV
jgi:hypothetical protein